MMSISCLQKGNIAEALLREGFARCVDWSIATVTGGPEKLRAAEKVAKEKQLRLWQDYKPSSLSVSVPGLFGFHALPSVSLYHTGVALTYN